MHRSFRNWFHYYKWYVIIGLGLVSFLIRWAGNLAGWTEKKPDLQIACICRQPLSGEALDYLERSFASAAGDYNGDGTVQASIHFYLTSDKSSVTEAHQSAAASEISLIGDINDCESYFFLVDDPDRVQINWQILADTDGNCPPPTDYSGQDKTLPLTELSFVHLPGLSDPYGPSPAGSGLTEKDLRVLSSLRLGRRCFHTDRQCRYAGDLSRLWTQLTEKDTHLRNGLPLCE